MATPADILSWRMDKTNQTTWEPSDMPEPHSWLQNLAIAIEVVLPLLAFVVIGLRCYIRVSTNNLGWDDHWIFGAMLLCIGQAVVSIIFIKAEYIGIHNAVIPPHDVNHPVFLNYIAGLIYNPILSMVKISVLVFLLRLAGTKPAAKVTIWALMFVTFGMMVAIFFSVVFVCDPVQYNWDPTITTGKCFPKAPFAIWTTIVAIVTDLLVLAIPFWIFLGLRMAKKAKIALLCVFALGFIVTIVGCVRLYFIYKANYTPPPPDGHFNIGYITTALETNLAVIAASGPALWPLARRWFPGFFRNLGLSRGFQGDIPDIETANMPHQLTKETSAASSRNIRLLNIVFSPRKDSGTGTRREGNRLKKGSDGGMGFGGVHTNHSIGGTTFALRDMRGDKARGRTEIRGRTPQESEEEIMTYNGIMRTTDYSVTRDDNRSSGATERSWWDHRPPRGGAGARGHPAMRSTMGSI